MLKELLLLQLRCGLYPSAVILPFPLGPCFSLWCAIQWQYLLFSAKWVPWGENSHICASPDSLHLGLQTDEAIYCPAELLQAPHSSFCSTNGKTSPASTCQPRLTPQSLDPCHRGAPKGRNWWAEWCWAIANVAQKKPYTVTMYQTLHSSSPQVNPYYYSP